ncbi:MAG: hypothetical protein DRP56_05595 [Planctomycetota bacterium]|nr:MAG: hypothetical protein DRP56_05595 [Planctomycetota bacterium]
MADTSLTIQSPNSISKREYLFLFVIFLLFGIYHSILYWGHQPVPHFDFNCFANLGHQMLDFQIPSNFKRVPVVGIFQVLLGKVAGGPSPDFAGGWLLNSIMHPLTIVFFWLMGRKIIGNAAIWFALIASINPWVIQLMTEAIVETTLLCGVVITFYFIFRGSNWAYLTASITTMVRYEGAALILAVFVLDMIRKQGFKPKLFSFAYSAAASVPLAVWMLGTVILWKSQGSTHYLKELGAASGGEFIFVKYLHLIWQVGFYPLLVLPPNSDGQALKWFAAASKIIVSLTFLWGCIYGLYKKQWNILALLIFFIPYICIHALHSFAFHRFCMIVSWIPLLISIYGLKCLWDIINKRKILPKAVIVILQGAVIVISFIWLVHLTPLLPKLTVMSKVSASLPYVSAGVAFLFFVAIVIRDQFKTLWPNMGVLSFVILVILSNQFVIAGIVGNGQRDIEYKYLIDWYLDNAEGENMALTAPVILQTMSPKNKNHFIHTNTFEADSPIDFVKECYQRKIRYVAWDSRMGLTPKNRYYGYWKMENIAPLINPKDNGPYKFVVQLRANKRRWMNVFELRRSRANSPVKAP